MKNKRKDVNQTDKLGNVWPIVLCLILAGGIFVLLLGIESRKLEAYEKGNVVIAISDIAANQEITKENCSEYFMIAQRPLSDIPEASYLEVGELVGRYVQCGIDAGSMVTKSMLCELGTSYEDAVLVGLNMEALGQSVVGTLRAGDKIDIYTVNTEENEEVLVKKVLGSVVIVRSYTGSGTAIAKDDEGAIAQYLTIPVHKEAVGLFYQALEEGRIEIVKHP